MNFIPYDHTIILVQDNIHPENKYKRLVYKNISRKETREIEAADFYLLFQVFSLLPGRMLPVIQTAQPIPILSIPRDLRVFLPPFSVDTAPNNTPAIFETRSNSSTIVPPPPQTIFLLFLISPLENFLASKDEEIYVYANTHAECKKRKDRRSSE